MHSAVSFAFASHKERTYLLTQ